MRFKATLILTLGIISAFYACPARASVFYFQEGQTATGTTITGQYNFTLGVVPADTIIKKVRIKGNQPAGAGSEISLYVCLGDYPLHANKTTCGIGLPIAEFKTTILTGQQNNDQFFDFVLPDGYTLLAGNIYSFSVSNFNYFFGTATNTYGSDTWSSDYDSSCGATPSGWIGDTACAHDPAYGSNLHDLFFEISDELDTNFINLTQPYDGQFMSSTTLNVCVNYGLNEVGQVKIFFRNPNDPAKSFYKNWSIVDTGYSVSMCSIGGFVTLDAGSWFASSSINRVSDNSVIVSQEAEVFFNVLQQTTGTSSRVIGVPEIDADICADKGVFAGALCQVGVLLFSPSSDSLNNFAKLKDDYKSKPPFGYFTAVSSALSGLTGSGTPAFALVIATPALDSIFSPINTGLAIIIWLMYVTYVYKRLVHIEL